SYGTRVLPGRVSAMVHAPREIGDGWFRVQPGEDVVAARIAGQLRHARAPIVEIAEDDRVRRAGLRARGRDVAVPHRAVLEPRLILRAADALHAERALLHHALLAHRH